MGGLEDLITTPEGWAVIITGFAALMIISANRRNQRAIVSVPGTSYDIRNAVSVTSKESGLEGPIPIADCLRISKQKRSKNGRV